MPSARCGAVEPRLQVTKLSGESACYPLFHDVARCGPQAFEADLEAAHE